MEDLEPPYYAQPDPLYFFDRWPLAGLSVESVRRLKIGLHEIHRDALRGHDAHSGWDVHVNWALRAYGVMARELLAAGLLTEDLVGKQIPEMVFDACITAYWIRCAIALPEKTCPDVVQFGQFWIDPRNLDRMFLFYLQPEISIWQHRLDGQSPEERRQPADPAAQREAPHNEVQREGVLDVPALGRAGETKTGAVSRETGPVALGDKSIYSVEAAAAVEMYLRKRQWNITEFSVQVQVSEKTIRKFLKTGRLRRSCFDSIAKVLGLTREQLLRGEFPTGG